MRRRWCLSAVYLLVIGFLFGLFTSGCEPWQAITFENQSLLSVKIDVRTVSLDFVGSPPSFTYDAQEPAIEPGQSRKLGTTVPNARSGGARKKYSVVAVNETNEVVFSRVFTWDELHGADWRVVIKAENWSIDILVRGLGGCREIRGAALELPTGLGYTSAPGVGFSVGGGSGTAGVWAHTQRLWLALA